MQDLFDALTFQAHFRRMIAPRDVLKLIYQNEFAGGHLITNVEECRARLCAECTSVSPVAGMPLTEPIGNGLCRVNLNSPDFAVIRPDDLFTAFLETAGSRTGSYDALWEKLTAVTEALRDGRLAFAAFEAEDFRAAAEVYRAEGFPVVSHTAAYRELYVPSYRVTEEARLTFLPADKKC